MQQNPRVAGIFLLLCGGFLGWLTIWSPMQDAWAHAARLSLSMKGIAITPMCLLLGMVYLFAPPGIAQMMTDRQNQHPLKWLIILGSVALGFGFYFWFKGYIGGFGYTFNGF